MNEEQQSPPPAQPKTGGLNTNIIIAVLIAVLLAFPVGYVVGAQMTENDANDATYTETAETTADDSEDMVATDTHVHTETHEVPEGTPAPTVKLSAVQDTKSGWNISLDVANFTFAPEHVNGDHVEGEGHAHIYVDGVKVSRVYGTDLYLNPLGAGSHEIKVTLNTNGHADYTVDGEVIADTVTVMEAAADDSASSTDNHTHNE